MTAASIFNHFLGMTTGAGRQRRFHQHSLNHHLSFSRILSSLALPQAAMQVNQDPKLQQRLAELERLAEENPNLKYDFDWGM